MGKKELVAKIASQLGGGQLRHVSEILDATLSTIKDEVKSGGSVNLIGFGTFQSRDVPARDYRNPANGETVHKPATTVAKCKLSKKFLV